MFALCHCDGENEDKDADEDGVVDENMSMDMVMDTNMNMDRNMNMKMMVMGMLPIMFSPDDVDDDGPERYGSAVLQCFDGCVCSPCFGSHEPAICRLSCRACTLVCPGPFEP